MASYLDRRYDELRRNWKGFIKALIAHGGHGDFTVEAARHGFGDCFWASRR